jgi:hypothetical protein
MVGQQTNKSSLVPSALAHDGRSADGGGQRMMADVGEGVYELHGD